MKKTKIITIEEKTITEGKSGKMGWFRTLKALIESVVSVAVALLVHETCQALIAWADVAMLWLA